MELKQNEKELLKIMLMSVFPDIKLDQACSDITGIYYLSGLGGRTSKLDIEMFKILEEILNENPSWKATTLLELIYISEYFNISINSMFINYTWLAEEETFKEIIRLDTTSLDSKDWFNDRYVALLLWISSGVIVAEVAEGVEDEFKLFHNVYAEGIEPSLVPYNKDDETEYCFDLGFRLGGMASEQNDIIRTKVRYLMEKQNLRAFINVIDGSVYFVKPKEVEQFSSSHIDRMWEFK